MVDKKKEISFEESLAKLEASAEALRKDEISLDEAMKTYEKGVEYYNKCNDILQGAKQKIEVYSR